MGLQLQAQMLNPRVVAPGLLHVDHPHNHNWVTSLDGMGPQGQGTVSSGETCDDHSSGMFSWFPDKDVSYPFEGRPAWSAYVPVSSTKHEMACHKLLGLASEGALCGLGHKQLMKVPRQNWLRTMKALREIVQTPTFTKYTSKLYHPGRLMLGRYGRLKPSIVAMCPEDALNQGKAWLAMIEKKSRGE